ncbi:MAG: restriction endonuclease subunit S [Pseudonocardiaceae bacterium]|nr:restriction endonuclease subunit S [Pseudonocardiaceae bacterium]
MRAPGEGCPRAAWEGAVSQRVTLGEVSERVDYGLTTSAVVDGDGPRFLRITDIQNSFIDWPVVPHCKASPLEVAKFELRTGDVVVARTGGSTGRSQWVKVDEPAVFASYLVRFRMKMNFCSRFIAYVLSSAPWLHHVAGVAHGKSAQPNMSASEMARFEFNCPSLGEQRAIAEVLGALDDKIAANFAVARTAEELLRADFETWRTDEKPTRPRSSLRLTDLVELNPIVARPTEEEPVYVDMQKMPVSGMSITDWSSRPAKGGARFQNGDTLLARITPCLENRKTGYVDFLSDGQIALGSTEYIVMRSRSGIPLEFSYFIATSEQFRTFAIRHMSGTSGRQRVSAADLADFQLAVPDPSWLESFGRKAGALFELVKSQRDENRTLAQTRDALLPDLMSGQIRVKNAEKRVEEVL